MFADSVRNLFTRPVLQASRHTMIRRCTCTVRVPLLNVKPRLPDKLIVVVSNLSGGAVRLEHAQY